MVENKATIEVKLEDMCGSQREPLVQTGMPLTTTTQVTTQEHKFSELWMASPEL